MLLYILNLNKKKKPDMNKIMYFAWFVFILWRKIKTYK